MHVVLWSLRAVAALSCLSLMHPPAGHAQIAFPLGDHLACVKIKDTTQRRGSYSVDLLLGGGDVGYPYPGCVVKTPAKLACFSAIRTFMSPSPVYAGHGLTNAGFFCYRAKCPKNVIAPLPTGKDPFGQHVIVAAAPAGPSIVCAAALSPSGAFLDAVDP